MFAIFWGLKDGRLGVVVSSCVKVFHVLHYVSSTEGSRTVGRYIPVQLTLSTYCVYLAVIPVLLSTSVVQYSDVPIATGIYCSTYRTDDYNTDTVPGGGKLVFTPNCVQVPVD